jgi:hypothetical protein
LVLGEDTQSRDRLLDPLLQSYKEFWLVPCPLFLHSFINTRSSILPCFRWSFFKVILPAKPGQAPPMNRQLLPSLHLLLHFRKSQINSSIILGCLCHSSGQPVSLLIFSSVISVALPWPKFYSSGRDSSVPLSRASALYFKLQSNEMDEIYLNWYFDISLNFLGEIMQSSNFSSSSTIVSPTIHQKEYMERKKLYTGYLSRENQTYSTSTGPKHRRRTKEILTD